MLLVDVSVIHLFLPPFPPSLPPSLPPSFVRCLLLFVCSMPISPLRPGRIITCMTLLGEGRLISWW